MGPRFQPGFIQKKKAELGAAICYFGAGLIKVQAFSREFLRPNWICFPRSRALLV